MAALGNGRAVIPHHDLPLTRGLPHLVAAVAPHTPEVDVPSLKGGREVDRILGVQPKSEIARRLERAIA